MQYVYLKNSFDLLSVKKIVSFTKLYKTYIINKVKLNLFQDIPVIVIFKAMGIVCGQEIVQLIGTEENLKKKIGASLEECQTLNIHSQTQALKYVIKNSK